MRQNEQSRSDISTLMTYPPIALSPRIPDPEQLHWSTFHGMHQWYMGNSPPERVEIISYLFSGVSTDPPEHRWLEPLDCFRLDLMYRRLLSGPQRQSFDDNVRWSGGEDPPRPAPPAPPPPDPVPAPPATRIAASFRRFAVSDKPEAGYCYLQSVVEAARSSMELRLGFNPTGPAVVAFLLDNVGVWTPEKLIFTTGRPTVDKKTQRTYVQAHLEENPEGAPLASLLCAMTHEVRVGADAERANLVAPTEPLPAPANPTVFAIRPRGTKMSVRVGCYARFRKGGRTLLDMQPMNNVSIAVLTAIFESVHLDSAQFTFTVDKSSDNDIYFGVNGGAALSGDSWYAAHIFACFGGSDQGIVTHKYDLPPDMPFSRELKAANLGNPPPTFHFGLSATATGGVTVQCNFDLTVSGTAPLPRMDMGSAAAKGLRDFGQAVVLSNVHVEEAQESQAPASDFLSDAGAPRVVGDSPLRDN